MSYPVSLDEYSADTLVIEIQERNEARKAGLCDYCFRSPETESCKFPGRHQKQDLIQL